MDVCFLCESEVHSPVRRGDPLTLWLRYTPEAHYLSLTTFGALHLNVEKVAELLMHRLRRWRGKRYRKEAAALLDISTHTYQCYEQGRRHPNKLALAELERRLVANGFRG